MFENWFQDIEFASKLCRTVNVNPDSLRKLIVHLSHQCFYNASLTVEDVQQLDYTTTPLAISERHTYARTSPSIFTEFAKQKFFEKNGINAELSEHSCVLILDHPNFINLLESYYRILTLSLANRSDKKEWKKTIKGLKSVIGEQWMKDLLNPNSAPVHIYIQIQGTTDSLAKNFRIIHEIKDDIFRELINWLREIAGKAKKEGLQIEHGSVDLKKHICIMYLQQFEGLYYLITPMEARDGGVVDSLKITYNSSGYSIDPIRLIRALTDPQYYRPAEEDEFWRQLIEMKKIEFAKNPQICQKLEWALQKMRNCGDGKLAEGELQSVDNSYEQELTKVKNLCSSSEMKPFFVRLYLSFVVQLLDNLELPVETEPVLFFAKRKMAAELSKLRSQHDEFVPFVKSVQNIMEDIMFVLDVHPQVEPIDVLREALSKPVLNEENWARVMDEAIKKCLKEYFTKFPKRFSNPDQWLEMCWPKEAEAKRVAEFAAIVRASANSSMAPSIYFTAYAMKSFTRSIKAITGEIISHSERLRVQIFSQSYFELLANVEKLRNMVDIIPARSDEEFDDCDIYFMDFHPNNAASTIIFPHSINNITQKLSELFTANPKKRRTLFIDITLNALSDSEVKGALSSTSRWIKNGLLNLVFVQSMTKFVQLGMDKLSAGILVVYNNNSQGWDNFNSTLSELSKQEPVDPLITQYFAFIVKHTSVFEGLPQIPALSPKASEKFVRLFEACASAIGAEGYNASDESHGMLRKMVESMCEIFPSSSLYHPLLPFQKISFIQAYLGEINENTRRLYALVLDKYTDLNVPSQKQFFELTCNTDAYTCYLSFNSRSGFEQNDQQLKRTCEELESLHKDIISRLFLPIAQWLHLPLTHRQSMGFPMSCINECMNSIRFTVGLEPDDFLQKYADVIAYVCFVLNREHTPSKFFDKTFRASYFDEKVSIFRAMSQPNELPSGEVIIQANSTQDSNYKLEFRIYDGKMFVRHYINEAEPGEWLSETHIKVNIDSGPQPVCLSKEKVKRHRCFIAGCLSNISVDPKYRQKNINVELHGKYAVFTNFYRIEFDKIERFRFGQYKVTDTVGNKTDVYFDFQNGELTNFIAYGKMFTRASVLFKVGSEHISSAFIGSKEKWEFFRVGQYDEIREYPFAFRYQPKEDDYTQITLAPGTSDEDPPVVVISRDRETLNKCGVTIYRREVYNGKSQIEIDFWKTQDPVHARVLAVLLVYAYSNQDKTKFERISDGDYSYRRFILDKAALDLREGKLCKLALYIAENSDRIIRQFEILRQAKNISRQMPGPWGDFDLSIFEEIYRSTLGRFCKSLLLVIPTNIDFWKTQNPVHARVLAVLLVYAYSNQDKTKFESISDDSSYRRFILDKAELDLRQEELYELALYIAKNSDRIIRRFEILRQAKNISRQTPGPWGDLELNIFEEIYRSNLGHFCKRPLLVTDRLTARGTAASQAAPERQTTKTEKTSDSVTRERV